MIAIMGYMAGFALRIMGALLGLHIAGFLLVAALRRSTTAWIRNARKVKVAVPHPWASEYIRNIHNLPDYEQKVSKARIDEVRPEGPRYTLSGWWFGIPWKAQFNMRYLDNGGFHSDVVRDSKGLAGVVAALIWIDGGFTLSDEPDGSTVVCHYENYRWPMWFPFAWAYAPVWALWHGRGMSEEMRVVKDAMEISHALSSSAAAKSSSAHAQMSKAGRHESGGGDSSPSPIDAAAPTVAADEGVRRRGKGAAASRAGKSAVGGAASAEATAAAADAAATPVAPRSHSQSHVPQDVSAYFRANKYDAGSFIKEKVTCTPYARPPLDSVLDAATLGALRAAGAGAGAAAAAARGPAVAAH